MPRFDVYQVQTETRLFTYRHVVEAATLEEAIEKAQEDDTIEFHEEHIQGLEWGDSGWGATAEEAEEAWQHDEGDRFKDD